LEQELSGLSKALIRSIIISIVKSGLSCVDELLDIRVDHLHLLHNWEDVSDIRGLERKVGVLGISEIEFTGLSLLLVFVILVRVAAVAVGSGEDLLQLVFFVLEDEVLED
jgi:hypothetical protein